MLTATTRRELVALRDRAVAAREAHAADEAARTGTEFYHPR
ncbi:MAG: hypothetical protein ACRDOM_11280 [Nocardioides sp.]